MARKIRQVREKNMVKQKGGDPQGRLLFYTLQSLNFAL